MNILIVDDETIIREWIQYTIQSFDFERMTVETASDGIETLEMITSFHYDVVFIDIQMPRMNGLELIEKIYNEEPNTLPVILSSHNDFDYAREALRHGAFEYILKSECNKDTLKNLLLKCNTEYSHTANTTTYQRSSYLQMVLQGKTQTEKLGTLPEIFFPELQHQSYCCFAFRNTPEIETASIQSNFLPFVTNKFIFLGNENLALYYIILLPSFMTANELENFLQPLFTSLHQKYPMAVFSSSQCYSSTQEIASAITAAEMALEQLFYSDKNYMLFSIHNTENIKCEVDTFCTEILDYIRQFDNHNLFHTIHNFNYWIQKNKPRVSLIQNTYYTILYSLFLYHFESTKSLPETTEIIKAKLISFVHFSDLVDYILLIIRQCILSLPTARLYSPHIDTALTFIAENYSDIHSVSNIAEAIHLNADYLTRLFKKETGKNICSYLMEYKLNIASNMLRTTNLSISDISTRVGIENISYFSKKFKEQFGVQPVTYRNKNQNNLK